MPSKIKKEIQYQRDMKNQISMGGNFKVKSGIVKKNEMVDKLC